MSYLYRDQNTASLAEHLRQDSLLILPIGTTEEHGTHLPVDTDARIAEAYGARLAAALEGQLPLLLLDTVRYGYSMKIMRNWPGTIIVRSRVFMDYIYDLCNSLMEMGFTKITLLDCHGHHSGALNVVSRELCDARDMPIAIISPAKLSTPAYQAIRKSPRGGSIHGGEWETSLVMHISPEVVDLSKATSEDLMRYQSEFVAGDNFEGSQKVTWSTWYLQPSAQGIYGDPLVASAETGKVIMEAAVEAGARFLMEFWRSGREG